MASILYISRNIPYRGYSTVFYMYAIQRKRITIEVSDLPLSLIGY
jgi:hypothetical protein